MAILQNWAVPKEKVAPPSSLAGFSCSLFQGKQKASRQRFLCPPEEQIRLALLQRLNQALEASVHTRPGQQFSPRLTQFGPRGKGGEKWIQEDNPVSHLFRAQPRWVALLLGYDFQCQTVEPMFWVSSLNMEEALPIMQANQSCPGQSHVLSGSQSLFPSTRCPPSEGPAHCAWLRGLKRQPTSQASRPGLSPSFPAFGEMMDEGRGCPSLKAEICFLTSFMAQGNVQPLPR